MNAVTPHAFTDYMYFLHSIKVLEEGCKGEP